MKRKYFITALLFLFFAGSVILYGDIGGKSGRTRKNSTAGCGSCHGSSANSGVSVTIDGPDTVNVGQTNQYSLTISMAGKTGAGLDISKRLGTLAPVSSNTHLSNNELVHSSNIPMTSSTVTVQFSYTAPQSTAIDTIWATALATNSNGGTGGDSWNWAPNKSIVVRLPVGIQNISTARDFSISQNYPNPFNPETNIKIDLLKDMNISVNILDVLGDEVSTIQSGRLDKGEHIIKWNGLNFPSGVYYYEVKGDEFSSAPGQTFTLIKKMLLLK
ncbi:MAG: choice-of-anchor V domain-containing protein [Ignavibacteria bacterium]